MAAPVSAGDEHDCFQGAEPRLRIKGCSEMIQRSPNDATAYHNRAVAYALAGDIDSAIADYTKVIQIAPDNPSAYDSRGRAYASKGDYTHAVNDVTKAKDLLARATAQPAAIPPKTAKPTKPKTAAVAPTGATPPPKKKAVPNGSKSTEKEAPSSGWWWWPKLQ